MELVLNRYEDTGDAVVDININECLTVPNIRTNIGDILEDLKIHGCIGSDSMIFCGGGLGIYLTTDGIEYFKNKQQEERKMERNVTYNVNGGQVIFANDNSVVNATQNNGINLGELNSLISEILGNLSGMSPDDAATIKDSVEMLHEELSKPKPKKSILNSGVKLIAPLIGIANGIPTLAGNLQKLIDFVGPYIQ